MKEYIFDLKGNKGDSIGCAESELWEAKGACPHPYLRVATPIAYQSVVCPTYQSMVCPNSYLNVGSPNSYLCGVSTYPEIRLISSNPRYSGYSNKYLVLDDDTSERASVFFTSTALLDKMWKFLDESNKIIFEVDDSINNHVYLPSQIHMDVISLKRRIEKEHEVLQNWFEEVKDKSIIKYYAVLQKYREVQQRFLRLLRSLKAIGKRILALSHRVDHRTTFRMKINLVFKSLDDEDHIA
jgi:hypothetical protein